MSYLVGRIRRPCLIQKSLTNLSLHLCPLSSLTWLTLQPILNFRPFLLDVVGRLIEREREEREGKQLAKYVKRRQIKSNQCIGHASVAKRT